MLKTLHDPQMCIGICSRAYPGSGSLTVRLSRLTRQMRCAGWPSCASRHTSKYSETFSAQDLLQSSQYLPRHAYLLVHSSAFNSLQLMSTIPKRLVVTNMTSGRSICQIQEQLPDRSWTKSARYRRSTGKIAPPASSQDHCGCRVLTGQASFRSWR